jgi:hypothetical protein
VNKYRTVSFVVFHFDALTPYLFIPIFFSCCIQSHRNVVFMFTIQNSFCSLLIAMTTYLFYLFLCLFRILFVLCRLPWQITLLLLVLTELCKYSFC